MATFSPTMFQLNLQFRIVPLIFSLDNSLAATLKPLEKKYLF